MGVPDRCALYLLRLFKSGRQVRSVKALITSHSFLPCFIYYDDVERDPGAHSVDYYVHSQRVYLKLSCLLPPRVLSLHG